MTAAPERPDPCCQGPSSGFEVCADLVALSLRGPLDLLAGVSAG